MNAMEGLAAEQELVKKADARRAAEERGGQGRIGCLHREGITGEALKGYGDSISSTEAAAAAAAAAAGGGIREQGRGPQIRSTKIQAPRLWPQPRPPEISKTQYRLVSNDVLQGVAISPKPLRCHCDLDIENDISSNGRI